MFLNIMDEKGLRNEWELIMSSDTIRVSVLAKWSGSFCLPDANGDVELFATFKPMTCQDYWSLENDCSNMVETEFGETKNVDYQRMRKEIVRRMLTNWNLDIKLDIDEITGWLTDESWLRAVSIPGPLMNSMLTKYEESIHLADGEDEKIEKQGTILFRPKSKGVDNPCPAISLFCTLSNFWDKFGLNKYDLSKLSYKEYVMLRMMLSKENEAMASQSGKGEGHTRAGKFTRIAGQGGRIRQDTGQVIPL